MIYIDGRITNIDELADGIHTELLDKLRQHGVKNPIEVFEVSAHIEFARQILGIGSGHCPGYVAKQFRRLGYDADTAYDGLVRAMWRADRYASDSSKPKFSEVASSRSIQAAGELILAGYEWKAVISAAARVYMIAGTAPDSSVSSQEVDKFLTTLFSYSNSTDNYVSAHAQTVERLRADRLRGLEPLGELVTYMAGDIRQRDTTIKLLNAAYSTQLGNQCTLTAQLQRQQYGQSGGRNLLGVLCLVVHQNQPDSVAYAGKYPGLTDVDRGALGQTDHVIFSLNEPRHHNVMEGVQWAYCEVAGTIAPDDLKGWLRTDGHAVPFLGVNQEHPGHSNPSGTNKAEKIAADMYQGLTIGNPK